MLLRGTITSARSFVAVRPAFTMLLIRRTLRATLRSIRTLHPEPHVATDRILSCQATAEALAVWDEGRRDIYIRTASTDHLHEPYKLS